MGSQASQKAVTAFSPASLRGVCVSIFASLVLAVAGCSQRQWSNPDDPEGMYPSFFYDFDDGHANGWLDDGKALCAIEGGEYSMQSPDDSIQHWSLHDFTPPGDFEFECDVRKIAGGPLGVFGIGIVQADDREVGLFIEQTGMAKVGDFTSSGGWQDLKNWTDCPAMDTVLGASNLLKMVWRSETLSVYVNGTVFGSFAATSNSAIKQVGLYVQNDIHAHFDSVYARSFP